MEFSNACVLSVMHSRRFKCLKGWLFGWSATFNCMLNAMAMSLISRWWFFLSYLLLNSQTFSWSHLVFLPSSDKPKAWRSKVVNSWLLPVTCSLYRTHHFPRGLERSLSDSDHYHFLQCLLAMTAKWCAVVDESFFPLLGFWSDGMNFQTDYGLIFSCVILQSQEGEKKHFNLLKDPFTLHFIIDKSRGRDKNLMLASPVRWSTRLAVFVQACLKFK